jgi:hypothetical protein
VLRWSVAALTTIEVPVFRHFGVRDSYTTLLLDGDGR